MLKIHHTGKESINGKILIRISKSTKKPVGRNTLCTWVSCYPVPLQQAMTISRLLHTFRELYGMYISEKSFW